MTYVESEGLSCFTTKLPAVKYASPLKTFVSSCITVKTSFLVLRTQFNENLGSCPPLPSLTSSLQYCDIAKKSNLSK